MNRAPLFAAGGALLILVSAQPALAHAVCGNRIFPATLTMDDPGVGDEFSFPTVQYVPSPPAAGGGHTTSYGFEWDKTITEHFGFSVSDDYVRQTTGGAAAHGWDNIEAGLKAEFLC